MAGFIFGGDTGLSYQDMVRQRERAQQMQQRASQAQGPGAGFNVLANGFASHILNKRANAAEAKGREGADTAFQNATGGGVLAQLFQQNLAGQPQEQAQPSGVSGAFEGAAASSGQFPASLVQTESGGNWKALNKEGYGGRLQFGAARLADAARAGVIPAGMSGAQFSQLPPAQQQAVENWHFSDIDQQAQRMGLDRYIGQNVGGVNVTQDAIRGMAHLGGIGGAAKFLQSGGQYNPADSNGTSLRDYGQRHGGGQHGGQAAPQAASMGGMNIPAIMEALANPYLDEGKRSVLSMLLQDSIQQRNAAQAREMQLQDPMRQIELQQAQINLQKSMQPEATDPWAGTKIVGDKVLRMGQAGPEVAGDFGTPKEQYRQLSTEEAQAMGLPSSASFQVGPDGKVSQIGGAGVTVNNNMGEDKFGEAFAKGDAEAIGGASEAGMSAQRSLGRIDQLERLMADSPSGWQGAAAQRAGEWGINTEGLGQLQAAQAMINSLVPEQRTPGSGPMSDADLNLFKQSLPRIINQPEGNKIIINTMRGIAQYDAAGAAIVQKLRAGELTRAQAFEALQNRQNPLAQFRAPQAEPEARKGAAVPTVGAIEDGFRYNGGDPKDPSSWEQVQ